jgi:competence protein ComEC
MSVLDVGQGDAVAVDFPDGSFMLVDGGGMPASSFDVGERVLAPALRARRRSRVDIAVISHPHPDHYGGLVTTLDRMSVGELWDTGEVERDGPAHGEMARILSSMRSRAVPVVRPASLCDRPRWFGRAVVEVLAPCPEPDPVMSTNDASFVLRVRFGARAIRRAGDLELEGEEQILAGDRSRLRADVLKIGHHGSKTSSSEAFLRAVSPRLAVISCGVRNRFGHPAPSVLSRLDQLGVRTARTDTGGEWRYWTDGDREWVTR